MSSYVEIAREFISEGPDAAETLPGMVVAGWFWWRLWAYTIATFAILLAGHTFMPETVSEYVWGFVLGAVALFCSTLFLDD